MVLDLQPPQAHLDQAQSLYLHSIIELLVQRISKYDQKHRKIFDQTKLVGAFCDLPGNWFLISITQENATYDLMKLIFYLESKYSIDYYFAEAVRHVQKLIDTFHPPRESNDAETLVNELKTAAGKSFLKGLETVMENSILDIYAQMLSAACGLLSEQPKTTIAKTATPIARIQCKADLLVRGFINPIGFFIFNGILNLQLDRTFKNFAKLLLKRDDLTELVFFTIIFEEKDRTGLGVDPAPIRKILENLWCCDGVMLILSSREKRPTLKQVPKEWRPAFRAVYRWLK